jgi:hypothetical protein
MSTLLRILVQASLLVFSVGKSSDHEDDVPGDCEYVNRTRAEEEFVLGLGSMRKPSLRQISVCRIKDGFRCYPANQEEVESFYEHIEAMEPKGSSGTKAEQNSEYWDSSVKTPLTEKEKEKRKKERESEEAPSPSEDGPENQLKSWNCVSGKCEGGNCEKGPPENPEWTYAKINFEFDRAPVHPVSKALLVLTALALLLHQILIKYP